MTRADSYEEMIRVFTPFPLDGENYQDFYVDTSPEKMWLCVLKANMKEILHQRNSIIN